MTNSDGPVGPAIAKEQAARIAAGYFTIDEAARDIGEIQGWHAAAVDTLREQMKVAARSGALVVRHPHTDLPYRPEVVRDFFELVTRKGVNEWLTGIDAPYRWKTYEEAAAEPRYIARRRLWKLTEAIQTIAALPGLGVTAQALMKRATKAAASREVRLRDVEDGSPKWGDNLSGFLGEWLFAEDINAWLKAAEFPEPYRLRDDMASDPAAPNCSDGVSARPAREVAKHRRARLLAWFEEEEQASGKHGAVARVFAREKLQRPTADRANVGADIRKARAERAEQRRAGALLGPLRTAR